MAGITAFILLLAIPNVFLGREDQEMEFGVESCSVCGVGREIDIENFMFE
jgi:hypothetical protein